MALDYLDFDYSEDAEGTGTWDAMACVQPQRLGALHAATLRVSVKVVPGWRLTLTVTGQLDVAGGVVSNPGGQALLGVLAEW